MSGTTLTTCCGCGTLAVGTAQCSLCPSTCTPLNVRIVLSGITTQCAQPFFGADFYDANGVTISGTFVAATAAGQGCTWRFGEGPPMVSFPLRFSHTGPTGASVCGGTVTDVSSRSSWSLLLGTIVVSGIRYWELQGQTLDLSSPGPYFFYGTTPFTDCKTSLTITNQLRSDSMGTAGTATLTFCV